MHDIWNPWHGCVKCSEGCAHCYMYFLDSQRGHNGAEIYRTKTGFHYPLSRDRAGNYKVKSGEQLRVCMTSDFFLEQADPWRREAWGVVDGRATELKSQTGHGDDTYAFAASDRSEEHTSELQSR